MIQTDDTPVILIAEDDPDQMELLVSYAKSEIKSLLDEEIISLAQQQEIKILKVSNIKSLTHAVGMYKNVLLALLDCNIPDTKGLSSHDQWVKTNHRITGQHKSVDIVTKQLPATPITMISTLNRFQRTIAQYYDSNHALRISFINKSDQPRISQNIWQNLNRHYAS